MAGAKKKISPKSKKKTAKKVSTKKALKVKRKSGTKLGVSKKQVIRKNLKRHKSKPTHFRKLINNPIIKPSPHTYWESEAVFNPGAVLHGGRIHLFYRALGADGVSRIGYVSSKDGVNFDKDHYYPVYMPEMESDLSAHRPHTSPARLAYNTGLYASGGGWGGCEDPRAVRLEGRVYMTFNIFNGWYSICVGLASIAERDLEEGRWKWSPLVYLSPPNERHKNWVLFPEKFGGKYAIFHNLYDANPSRVRVEYVEELDFSKRPSFKSPDPQLLPDREIVWHNRTRSIGPPPLKTEEGWLVFYHAMDKDDPNRYKLGALLLDLKDPRKILHRSPYPVLEPDEWYENDWKPGIIYASGAVIFGDKLFIYYGGGDKYVAVAYADLKEFLRKLMKNDKAKLSTKKSPLPK